MTDEEYFKNMRKMIKSDKKELDRCVEFVYEFAHLLNKKKKIDNGGLDSFKEVCKTLKNLNVYK